MNHIKRNNARDSTHELEKLVLFSLHLLRLMTAHSEPGPAGGLFHYREFFFLIAALCFPKGDMMWFPNNSIKSKPVVKLFFFLWGCTSASQFSDAL